MSIRDIIKDSVLESEMFNTAITPETILVLLLNIAIAMLFGILIYLIYKRFYNGVLFSRNYAITLVGMCVLSCMITLAISTNIVISLGMVGALSIVRYRTAIKEPLDLLYMFWAITTGITVGASMYILALIGAIAIILLAIFFGHGQKGRLNMYVLVVHYVGNGTGDEVIRLLTGVKSKYTVRSKIMRDNLTEMTIQVSFKRNSTVVTEKIQNLENVKDVSLIEFNGEYHG